MLCFYDSINASYLQQDWFKKVKAFLIGNYGQKRCSTSDCRCLLCNFSRETKIGAKEKQVLAERQGVDGDRHIATRQIGGDLAGHELGVGAGHIDVGVRTLQQTVDRPFPAGDLLNLIQQEITVPLTRHGFHQLVIHLLSGDIFGNVHLRVPLADDVIRRHAPPQQLLLQHLKNGGFTAATDARQDLDQRLVDNRRDGLDIIRPVDHGIASAQSLVYPKCFGYVTSFSCLTLKTILFFQLFCILI